VITAQTSANIQRGLQPQHIEGGMWNGKTLYLYFYRKLPRSWKSKTSKC